MDVAIINVYDHISVDNIHFEEDKCVRPRVLELVSFSWNWDLFYLTKPPRENRK
jgi:hypothetical protein